MEEIHRQQGVPVRVETVEYQRFLQEIDYSISVSGLRETRVYARISDQVQRINARIGQVVAQNDIIVEFPEDNAQANFRQARVAFDLADQTWQRMQVLFKTGGISQQELDGAETQFKVAEANWDVVQQLVYVRAPIAGTITDINVRELERVTPGDYMFTISQLNRLHGRIWVNENDIQNINRNNRVTFKWNEVERNARITNVGMSLNRDQNAFAVDIEIDNPGYAIRSGVTGTAIVFIYENPRAVMVPRNVVLRDMEGVNYVYLAVNGVAQRRTVQIGRESDINFEITEGLNVGDVLVVQGLQLLQEGSRLNVQR
jgi:RND family efflux transporter MFP subunit